MATEQKAVPLGLGGMYSSGSAALIPEGATRLAQNVLFRPGPRVVMRPPLRYSDLNDVVGLTVWDDQENDVQRLIALKHDSGNLRLYHKVASDAGWSGPVSATWVASHSFSMLDACTYRTKLYFTMSQSDSGRYGDPGSIWSYDGTTLTRNAIGGESLYARTVTPFIDRLFLADVVRPSGINRMGTGSMFDPTSGWATSNVTAVKNLISGAIYRTTITPTAATGAKIYRDGGVYQVPAGTTNNHFVLRCELKNTSATAEVPMTVEVYYAQPWVANTAYALGTVRVPTTAGGNGFRYRVTVAGTSHAATEPVWPTTLNATIVDNGVTWICEGTDAASSREFTLPTITEFPDWTVVYIPTVVSPLVAATLIGVRIKFGTTATPSVALTPVEFSHYGDTSIRNRGQQITIGKFFHEFHHKFTSDVLDMRQPADIYWTETSDPDSIDGNNYYNLTEAPGYVTAAEVVGNRYVVFKKRGMWVFSGTDDPDNPLLKESYFANVGCVGPDALVVFEDKLYFLGETGFYMYEPGGEPRELSGDSMREAIVANADDFVRYPSVAVDEDNRDVYVVAKSATDFFTYDLDRGWWSKQTTTIQTAATGYGFLTYYPSAHQLYVPASVSPGTAHRLSLHRLASSADDLDGAAAANVVSRITFRPLEAMFPQREIKLEEVGVFAAITGTSTLTAEVSLDGGATFSKSHAITALTVGDSSLTKRNRIVLAQGGQKLVVRLSHTGTAGEEYFNLSAVEAVIRDLGPQRNLANPTTVSASL